MALSGLQAVALPSPRTPALSLAQNGEAVPAGTCLLASAPTVCHQVIPRTRYTSAAEGQGATWKLREKPCRLTRLSSDPLPRGRSGSPNAATSTASQVSCSSQSLAGRFAELKERGEVAVIPFIVAGDPDLATTADALLALDRSGADIIELGVPYSDPLADGPVIQAAATRALAKGTDLSSVLTLLSKVSPQLSAPIVLFTYYNPIMKRGPEKFFRDAKAAGAAGLVIPDIPLEETPPLRQLATANGLELVLLTTPTTPVERMASIAEAAQGFLYLVSLTGVTGARAQVEARVEKLLTDIKGTTDKPVAVGFGISTGEHAAQVVQWGADGVIVGSKVVSLLAGGATPQEGLEAISSLIRTLKQAVRRDLQKC